MRDHTLHTHPRDPTKDVTTPCETTGLRSPRPGPPALSLLGVESQSCKYRGPGPETTKSRAKGEKPTRTPYANSEEHQGSI
jgi:hypothetical protein